MGLTYNILMRNKISFVIKSFFLGFFMTVIFSCNSSVAEQNQENRTYDSADIESDEEYNFEEIAKYATYINNIFAADDNLTGFWWDCSDIVLRKELSAHQNVIDGIMKSYDGKENYHKKNSGYTEEAAQTAVQNMQRGWNLGNTLDANSYKAIWDDSQGKWYDNWASSNEEEKGWMVKWNEGIITWETGWGQPKTSNEIIALVKKLGFDAVRMPVTWGEHIDDSGNIDSVWLARVKECVNYVLANDMYCIINLHHDGGSDGWIKACESSWDQYNKRFENIWSQIAETFKDYDERLIFESMNEVLDEKATWNPSKDVAEKANIYINKWNQLFVDSIRASGGNNASRNLVVMTYAGDGSSNAFSGFKLPSDSAENHLIIEVHNYSPHSFTSSDATWTQMTAIWNEEIHGKVLDDEIGMLSQKALEYGVPVIIGEYAAFPKKYADFD